MNQTQKLKWFILSGITETTTEEPVNRMQRGVSLKQEPVEKAPQKKTAENDVFSRQSEALATQSQTITELYQNRSDFDGCSLKRTAAHTLNGYGVAQPTVLCYVEAPDTIDEKEAHLMSGEAGTLLEKMLGAIGLNLNQNAYVSSLIPWRPPGNRKPTEVELSLCRPFWEREIALLKPKIILLFGANVSSAMLGISALSKARGVWHTYQGIPVRVSIAPATLIKFPAQKKQAWEDLQQVQKKLGEY